MDQQGPLSKTPLHALHQELGGKLVPFAGYEMPVQYPAGIMKEHLHTRSLAGLFDVSHMGQLRLIGPGAAAALERLVPGELQALAPGRMRYTLFTNEQAGILDDLMVTRVPEGLFLVVNASCKDADIAHLRANLDRSVAIEPLPHRALLALQGPAAEAVLARFAPDVADMGFMSGREVMLDGVPAFVTRSGYTGEDGFEISVAADAVEGLARQLLAEPEVMPIGLGARDSLRLEAGLCLYGHDLDQTTTPIEAALAWAIGQRRRKEGGFPGDAIVQRQLAEGPPRKRVGIRPEGRAPAREGTEIVDTAGRPIGRITSGGFGPSADAPIAMGYVAAGAGPELGLIVRGRTLPAKVAAMPFVPHRYHRSGP